jgi:hypothetical protein
MNFATRLVTGSLPARDRDGAAPPPWPADNLMVNPLSATPDSTPDPQGTAGSVQARLAEAAAIKVLKVQAEMSKDVLRLLDPAAGTLLNRTA